MYAVTRRFYDGPPTSGLVGGIRLCGSHCSHCGTREGGGFLSNRPLGGDQFDEVAFNFRFSMYGPTAAFTRA